jgi:hypothetical protein
MPHVLTREEIFAAEDRKFEFVKVPEWSGGDPEAGVWVKGLSGTDRDSFELGMLETKGRKQEVNLRNLRAKLIVRTAVDSDDPETAKNIFTLVDIAPLGRKSAAALQRVYAMAQKLSGLSNEDVEELTVGLGEGESDGSGLGSLLPSGIVPSPSANAGSVAESSPNGLPTTASSPLEIVD